MERWGFVFWKEAPMNVKELTSLDSGNCEGKPPDAGAKRRKVISGPSTAIRVASTLAYVGAAINLLLGVVSMISKSPASLVFFFKAAMMLAIGNGLRKEDRLYVWLSVIFSGIFAALFVLSIFVRGVPVASMDVVLLWIATIIVYIKRKEFY
jgi:hypothetical protein